MKARRLCSVARPVALAALVMAAGCAARQPQRPTVVVLEVKGASGGVWQDRVAELVAARDLEVIPAESYWVMATRLGAQPLTDANVARVASALGASAVVHGRVKGKRRRQVVAIYVRAGESGRIVERHRVKLRRGVAVRRSEAALERRLLASIAPDAAPAVSERPSPDRKTAKKAGHKKTAEKTAAKKTAPKKTAAKTAKTARPARSPKKSETSRPARRAEPVRSASAPPDKAQEPRSRRTREPSGPEEKAPPVVYDESGQAVDDEMPSVLR
ncbi:MAG TPA: hypothetical protein VNO33_22535 [Kofleriaceae bacterium]|nr:hypothetical protein [Kofleriaceae bacterium]